MRKLDFLTLCPLKVSWRAKLPRWLSCIVCHRADVSFAWAYSVNSCMWLTPDCGSSERNTDMGHPVMWAVVSPAVRICIITLISQMARVILVTAAVNHHQRGPINHTHTNIHTLMHPLEEEITRNWTPNEWIIKPCYYYSPRLHLHWCTDPIFWTYLIFCLICSHSLWTQLVSDICFHINSWPNWLPVIALLCTR